ncbi:aminotransferase class IV [Streptomyces sp. NPDC032472]|uniref:aminotransferase class IV n=1 Tax=Streptomyces sp. NPDC032472 TaxID=3155018 RepID=UPI0033F6403C
MATPLELLVWNGEQRALHPHRDTEPPAELAVADSWLVEDGRARALDLHFDRFSRSCTQHAGAAPAEVAAFLTAVREALPARGRWFPRIELTGGAGAQLQLALRLRPAPPPGGPARLWVYEGPDPRAHPRIKGPDLHLLAAVREGAVRAGCDEALLLGPDGELREGAYSSVLWWHGDVLCAPPAEAQVLPGVTRQLLLDLARAEGRTVRLAPARLGDLDGAEVWITSALHGIRPVAGRIAAGADPAPAHRFAAWNARLAALARPVR